MKEDGSYVLPGVPPARYEMTVRRIGSEPQTRIVVVRDWSDPDPEFRSYAAGRSAFDSSRQRRGRAETRTSEGATNVNQAQISKLPTPSRNFLDLAQLLPHYSDRRSR